MTLARPLAAALLVVTLAGCASARRIVIGPTTTTTTTTTSTTGAPGTSTTTSTTTATVPGTTTTETGGPYFPFTTPDAAVMAFVNTWRHGDRAGAAHVATPDAIASLFAVPPPTSAFDFRGCNSGLGGMSSCIYRVGASSALSIQLRDVPPTHWQVVQASFLS